MKKIRALIAFQIKVALDNKIDFLYTFIMPLAYLLVNFFSSTSKHIHTANQLSILLPFVGYMVITGVINGWVMNTLMSREKNFLKTFTSIVGNKFYIFTANFFVNLVSNVVQISLVVVIFQMITNSFNFSVLLLLIITAILMDILVSLASTIILVSRMKLSSIPMILTTYIIVGLVLSGIQTNNLLFRVLLNSVSMYTLTSDLGGLLYHISDASLFNITSVLLPSILIVLVGTTLMKKVPVSSIHTGA